jgi:hypothetical protein
MSPSASIGDEITGYETAAMCRQEETSMKPPGIVTLSKRERDVSI